ncbi:MAG: putative zinc-binding metallopeptidase [Acidobacteriota bacterium]|nr:MAG: putative zinc-binding metallopeptidase [Acidobacteriota bacterium]
MLDVRLSRLRLRIEGTALEARIGRLYRELERAGLRFRPYIWLSTDFFTPMGATGFAVPFYLAHPRLARLERRQMLEIEGGSHTDCMKLLRHETGHAIDNAYRLHRKKRWREIFGRFSEPYRNRYTPRPTSRKYVHNLEFWYAQSHPMEDFAETFSIWLQPRSNWRERYKDWPALKKLEYVDALMEEIRGERSRVRTRERYDSLPTLNDTLRSYYRKKRARYLSVRGIEFDESLRRLFSDEAVHYRRVRAGPFLERSRDELRRRVSAVTGQHPYVIDQMLKEMILRCRAMNLRLMRSERESRIDAAVLLTTLTMTFLHGGHPEYHR